MNHWFTRSDAPVDKTFLKRFTPTHWTVDFPRGAMASVTCGADAESLIIDADWLRRGDLVGLIWDSVDAGAHPAQARETSRDYSGCRLSFRWQASGVAPLDGVNGAVLTIEGSDANGEARAWYVRLWNYAVGSPNDARVTIDFDQVDGGYLLPGEAQRVNPRAVERMFISLVPPDYVAGGTAYRSVREPGRVTISEMRCTGAGGVLACGDAIAPENGLGMCTAYDDLYHVNPDRLIAEIERTGYRGTITHYVGMSHYPTLGTDGLVKAEEGLCTPAAAWHRSLAKAAKAHEFRMIWSLSYELLDQICPDQWKQRFADGSPAATGYIPPSALLSPASAAAIAYLGRIARELVQLSVDEGLAPLLQLGEPWWWVDDSGRPALYDAAATGLLGEAAVIADIGGPIDEQQRGLLDRAGVLLAQSTLSVIAKARAQAPATVTHLLLFLPGLFDPARPEVRRANVPVDWAFPAFDVLQLEDYDWVTSGEDAKRAAARSAVEVRLGYARDRQHYLAGFATRTRDHGEWRRILRAAEQARALGVAETFVWAWPQVARDGLTIFGDSNMIEAFADVDFPIAIGQEASVATAFSTNVVTSASGHEFRNANWQQARLRFDAGPGVRGESELGALIAFFRARRGPATAFRFRDPFDSSSAAGNEAPSASDQAIGTGDAAETRFALIKTYGGEERRRITRPVAGSVRVAIDGVERVGGWVVEPQGWVRFDDPPAAGAAVSAGFLFDVPVRFADDRIEISRASFAAGEAPSVPLIEVREIGE